MWGCRAPPRDISERRAAEERRAELENQVRRSQKLESIGTLAGGIAHDFNNILASVLGYSEMALYHVEKGSKLEANIKEVHRAGLRAKELVKQILTFSRQSEQEKKPVLVSLIAKEVVKMMRSTISTSIEIRHDIKSTSLVMADATQIHQVMMNLCTNASHAIEDGDGTLDVVVEDVEIDSSFTHSYPDLKPGKYMKIKVSDTGSGIEPYVMASMFEPYFTTKKPGEGTGLGLSVVLGIVKEHKGEITVESERGKGSTFTVYFPVLEKVVLDETEAGEDIPTGSESILLIDDESAIVDVGKQILERLGYSVTAKTSSTEALELFKTGPDSVDLVITDMNMPNMSGDRLSVELLKIRPDIPIVLCTGYSKNLSPETAREIGVKAFVMKPLVRAELAKTVRNVLDRVTLH